MNRENVIKKRGQLLVVSGPSGAGKGTICRAFLEANPYVHMSVSATTRQPRSGEIDGVNYYFLTRNQFEHRIAMGQFYEYAENYGNLYGTPKAFVEKKLQQGEDVILEIDIKGAFQVKAQQPNAVYIFILPPDMTELKNRIIKRGSETDSSLKTRMASAYQEIDCVDSYDYYIVNRDVEQAVKVMESILLAEKHRVGANAEHIINSIKQISK